MAGEHGYTVCDKHKCCRELYTGICSYEEKLGDLLKSTLKDMPENCGPRECLKQVCNVLMNARELSAQEAAYRAVGLPLRTMSRTFDYVDCNKPSQHTRILKSAAELDKLTNY